MNCFKHVIYTIMELSQHPDEEREQWNLLQVF